MQRGFYGRNPKVKGRPRPVLEFGIKKLKPSLRRMIQGQSQLPKCQLVPPEWTNERVVCSENLSN